MMSEANYNSYYTNTQKDGGKSQTDMSFEQSLLHDERAMHGGGSKDMENSFTLPNAGIMTINRGPDRRAADLTLVPMRIDANAADLTLNDSNLVTTLNPVNNKKVLSSVSSKGGSEAS